MVTVVVNRGYINKPELDVSVVVGVAVQLESVFVEVECLIQCSYWMNFYGILNAQSPEAESYWQLLVGSHRYSRLPDECSV